MFSTFISVFIIMLIVVYFEHKTMRDNMSKVRMIFIALVLLHLISVVNAENLYISPIQDTYVSSISSSENFATLPYLLSCTSATKIETPYLMFYVPEHVESAVINIFVVDGFRTNANLFISQVSSDWDESEITWTKGRPTKENWQKYSITSQQYTVGQWVSFDVSSVVNEPGFYSFMLRSDHGMWQSISSTRSASNQPHMSITTCPYDDDIVSNSKTNNDSYSFLVDPGESVTFSVTPPESSSIANYVWYVNKVNQNKNANSMAFTVPEGDISQPSTCIWEIRVEGIYENNSMIIREWLISSLTEEQAPDFIDFFIDRDNRWRSGHATDPWGRLFPSYSHENNYITNGYLTGTDTSTGGTLTTKFDISCGTYMFKIRNPGVLDIASFIVYDTGGSRWNMQRTANEFHDYFAVVRPGAYIPISKRWLGQAPGAHWWSKDGDNWRDLTIIKTADGWYYLYENGVLLPFSFGNLADAVGGAATLTLASNSQLQMDCIQVYENQYIYPKTTIEYKEYSKWWYLSDSSTSLYSPVKDTGIILSGRGVTLQQISETIGDSSLISYDSETRTAVLKTNLSLSDGSQLVINNERLVIDTYDRPLSINPKVGASIEIIDSTVTATKYPMVWNFASSISQNVFDPENTSKITAKSQTARNLATYDFRGILLIENSIIDNTCNLFLDGPFSVTMKNVVFSNHSSVDYGDYTYSAAATNHNNKKRQSSGEKGLWIVPRLDLTDLTIENISFVDSKSDISFKIIGGEWIVNSTIVKDSNLSGVDISAMKAHKYEYFQNYWIDDEPCTLSLLNTIYDEEKLSISGYRTSSDVYEYDNARILTKYYLDIKVMDSDLLPISCADIIISSSNPSFPAENLYKYRDYVSDSLGPGQGGVSGYGSTSPHNTTYTGGWYARWYNGIELGTISTDSKGESGYDAKSSIVLTSNIYSGTSGLLNKESLMYTMNVVAPNGHSVFLTDISPDSSWYRENPNVPAYTITAVIPSAGLSGPQIIGFAPGEDNRFVIGESKKFRIWANEPLDEMNWYMDGNLVSTGSIEYEWNISEGSHTISFVGSNTNGPVAKSWSVTATSEVINTPVPESSGSGTSFTPSATSFTSSVGSSTTFSVDSEEQFTSAKWYFNGAEVASGTSYTQNWAASGSFTVRFDGVTDLGTLSRTWNVLVSGSEYSDISIIPSASIVKPGETFSLDVYIDPKQPVTGAQFNLHYGSLASVTSVKDGGLFKTGGLTNTFQSGLIDNSAGVLKNVYSAIVGSGTVTAPGSMAKVNMVAGSSSGMLELTMSNVVLSDAYSNPAPYDISYASVLVDTAPVFNTIPAKSVEEESTLTFMVSATDADGDILTYSCTSLPQGATFDASTKTFRWTPSRGQAGTYNVEFGVTDGYLNDTTTTTITVSTLDRTPVITLFEPASGSVFEEGRTIDMRVVAEDPEGKALSYIMTIDGVQVSSSTSYQWITDYSSAGTHSIGVTVSDGNIQASRTHTITITDVHPRWDVNQDGVVNILDITLVGQNYGRTYTDTLPRWDVNQDGIVNVQDMSIVAGRFGETVQ